MMQNTMMIRRDARFICIVGAKRWMLVWLKDISTDTHAWRPIQESLPSCKRVYNFVHTSACVEFITVVVCWCCSKYPLISTHGIANLKPRESRRALQHISPYFQNPKGNPEGNSKRNPEPDRNPLMSDHSDRLSVSVDGERSLTFLILIILTLLHLSMASLRPLGLALGRRNFSHHSCSTLSRKLLSL